MVHDSIRFDRFLVAPMSTVSSIIRMLPSHPSSLCAVVQKYRISLSLCWVKKRSCNFMYQQYLHRSERWTWISSSLSSSLCFASPCVWWFIGRFFSLSSSLPFVRWCQINRKSAYAKRKERKFSLIFNEPFETVCFTMSMVSSSKGYNVD